ncbi:CoA-acylating methylmalonate-semialdehyde dehydrogenase [Natronorubrum sp. DTA7]|uniref:CoA-acylating methylmalonate-semialdehyde dehydrogenase n=1 Tax=Natronorubrum sp. DTA7 TaxID=3447016 RepID=UPI003F84A7EB
MVELQSIGESSTVRNYVDGDWRDASGTDELTSVNPATGEELATVPFSSADDVDEIVQTGTEAFEEWSARPVEERIQPLFELKQLLEDHQDELAELLVQDHGKTFAEASGELRRGIENVEVACGIPSMMQSGSLLNAAPDIDESAVRKPLGVFTAITPFNFPGMIPLWFLPYAVATGNSFILKPSEQNPLVAQRLFELVDEAGFPDGVLQLVNGGPDTVNALLDHEGVEGASFVGSTPIAKLVYERAAKNGKRAQAQGGAKNHIIVTETADLEFTAEKTVSSAFACGGERCLANDIALIEESVYEEFTDLVVEEAASQVVGYGLDEGTDIGALISPEHEQTVRNYVQTGIEEGAELLLDGRDVTVEGYEDGNFLAPTVFGDVTEDMVISQEEIFGPVLGLAAVSDVDEAIERMNGSQFGNAASLFTGSGADARKFRHEGDIGNLGVNVGTSAPMAFFHFGGWKDSFFGDLHAQGEDMIHFYTDKAVYIERWPDA